MVTELNVELKLELLELLLKKGFSYKSYDDQKLKFYTLIIEDKDYVKSKIKEHYFWVEEEDFDDSFNVKFLIEIREDLSTAQWTFIDGLDEFYVFENIKEFVDYLKELPDKFL